jgi:hypothetical protein
LCIHRIGSRLPRSRAETELQKKSRRAFALCGPHRAPKLIAPSGSECERKIASLEGNKRNVAVRTHSYFARRTAAKSPAPVGALRVQYVGIKFSQGPVTDTCFSPGGVWLDEPLHASYQLSLIWLLILVRVQRPPPRSQPLTKLPGCWTALLTL